MKLKKQEPVEIVAILDRSGSMSSIKDDAIGGFNTFLEAQKKDPSPANISVVLFDDKYELLYDDVPLSMAKPLTDKTYVPRGMTALNDAIGRTLTRLFEDNPKRAILCILTDGFENSSQEFTSPQVKELITRAQNRDWQVVYLAANQDAFAVGNQQYGISLNTISNFDATAAGTKAAYRGLVASVSNYRGA